MTSSTVRAATSDHARTRPRQLFAHLGQAEATQVEALDRRRPQQIGERVAEDASRVYDRRKFGWREGHRVIPVDALLHPSVLERLALPGVLDHGDIVPYRPHALREHWAVRHFWEADAAAAGRQRASRSPAVPGRRIEPHWGRARG